MFKQLNKVFKSISLNLTVSLLKAQIGGGKKMAYDSKKVAAYGAAGILIASFIILAVQLMPTPFMPTQTGTLVIKITDAPADLKHLNLTIDSFEVKPKKRNWTEVAIPEGRISFDLLQLSDSSIDAAIGQLEAGNYTMIRMHIVEGLPYTNATLNNSDPIEINVPSEKIKVITPTFEIKPREYTTIVLDLQVDTVHLANNPQHNLAPAMKIDVTVIYS